MVSLFLPQIVDSSEDEKTRREMHSTTWKALDEAAAEGHVSVLHYVVDYATECGYIELYTVSGKDDALALVIAGVAPYLLGVHNIQWDLESAYEKAIDGQQPKLANRIPDAQHG
ncbi:hypothetical protein F441_19748 [Phytophthora nicotianae CJ01A1]|nr:hypothetical protein L917_19063 [Phytophthora nicotianae]ETP03276.1 hypothetical protein F441_19748 [Phytophthora nicotianae CJ01A1]ETP31444.1 hypothetical protein F442_19692 [Phytophthora nicotianae P10297]